MITIDQNDYLDIEEAVQCLIDNSSLRRCKSRATLYNYFRQYGTPPSIKVGKKIYFNDEDLAEWATNVVEQMPKKQPAGKKPKYTPDDLFSVPFIPKNLGICRATLYNYFAEHGRPESTRIGKKVYFVKTSFREWANQIPEFEEAIKTKRQIWELRHKVNGRSLKSKDAACI